MSGREEIVARSHALPAGDLLDALWREGRLLCRAEDERAAGHEFLLSNEFDGLASPQAYDPVDVIIGFGSNSLWDLALLRRASALVVADWSPWPVIAHAYLLAPLLRVARTPQELVAMVSGMPPGSARSWSLAETFARAKAFSLSPIAVQRPTVLALLEELAAEPVVDDLELRFLATYLRPRVGDDLNPRSGYGPFPQLESPNRANLTYFLQRRYDPGHLGEATSVLSSAENFAYLKTLFRDVRYGVCSVMDASFYASVVAREELRHASRYAVAVSNIFECGHYNGLSHEDLNELRERLRRVFSGKSVTLHRTSSRTRPFTYVVEDLT